MKQATFIITFILFLFDYGNSQSPVPSSLKDYIGIYVFPDGSVVPEVEVILTDSVLTMNSVAGSSVINQAGVDTFYIVQFDGIAIFSRNENREVIKVHIDAQGYILDGEKKSNGGSLIYSQSREMDLVRERN